MLGERESERCEIKGKDGRNARGKRKGDTVGRGVDRLMDGFAADGY